MSTEDEKLLKEAKKLPWDERLLHKNWKVRNDANLDLAAICDSITDPKDPRLREFGPLFRKTVADSNAPVQEKALDALLAFLRAADADVGRYAKEVCDSIVAKCLNGRPKTVEKAQAAFLLWVELEATDVFLEAMEKAIKNKVAKAVVPAIDVMFQALSEFGTKVVPPKKILKMLPELFDHQDQNVRASSKGLTLELCRWIGKDHVKSILFEKMRDTMKKELEAELANVSGSAKPSRKIRSEQDKEPEQEAVTEVVGAGASEESVADAPQEIDEYELVDPVDILTPLEKSGFWDGVRATKWSERRDGVAELTKLASAEKIAPGDFSEICQTLKKLVMDVNLAVSVESIQAIGNLARGLRNHFAGGSRFLLPVLLEKLKEEKQVVLDALTQTLQMMHKSGCLALADVVEDVKVAVKNKVPLVRSLTLNWVTYCIETSNKAVVLKLHKDYVPICMECLNDGTPEVRDAAFAALAATAKMIDMRPLERSLEKLDEVRKKKLSEMIGSSSGGAVSGIGSGPASTSGVGASSHGWPFDSTTDTMFIPIPFWDGINEFLIKFAVPNTCNLQGELPEHADMMFRYKIRGCSIVGHTILDRNSCFYLHAGEAVVRRHPRQHLGQGCPRYPHCLFGDACVSAHGRLEAAFHPSLYKTQFCQHFISGSCRQIRCSFAHGEGDLRTPTFRAV